MTTAAVAARGLAKRFGPVAALRGVDVSLEAGEVLVLLGPNGAGKSTLLRILAGLCRPSEGSLEVLGDDALGRGRTRARGRVGLVSHATLLHPELSARENLIFAGRLHGIPEPGRRADVLLEDAGLADVAKRRTGGFSRGMSQRLAIARAIVHDPPLVLLDEPFTGLDRAAAARLLARLEQLKAAGRSLVLVSHDIPRSAEIADQAIILARGAIAHTASHGQLGADTLEDAYERATEGPR